MTTAQSRLTGYHWPILILALVSSAIALTPTIPNDLWWHLKAGAIIAQQGIPRTNLFAWTLPADAPYTYQSWLAEWLFYQLYTVGGLALVVFARNVLGTLAFGLVAYNASRRSGSWPLAAGVTLLALMMTLNQLTTRPQNWSWVLCALIAVLLRGYAQGTCRARALLVIPALTVLWVNLHGAFVLALLLVGLYALGETLQHGLKRPLALSWTQLRPLYGTALLTGLATLVNPQGWGIITYVLTIFDNPAITQYVVEWQPPSLRPRHIDRLTAAQLRACHKLQRIDCNEMGAVQALEQEAQRRETAIHRGRGQTATGVGSQVQAAAVDVALCHSLDRLVTARRVSVSPRRSFGSADSVTVLPASQIKKSSKSARYAAGLRGFAVQDDFGDEIGHCAG